MTGGYGRAMDPILCPDCGGDGVSPCLRCGGSGGEWQSGGGLAPCEACGGDGVAVCKRCDGEGTLPSPAAGA